MDKEVEALIRLLNERSEGYGDLRASSLTAIAMDRAASQLAAMSRRLAATSDWEERARRLGKTVSHAIDMWDDHGGVGFESALDDVRAALSPVGLG